jgi:hypothetical protein
LDVGVNILVSTRNPAKSALNILREKLVILRENLVIFHKGLCSLGTRSGFYIQH